MCYYDVRIITGIQQSNLTWGFYVHTTDQNTKQNLFFITVIDIDWTNQFIHGFGYRWRYKSFIDMNYWGQTAPVMFQQTLPNKLINGVLYSPIFKTFNFDKFMSLVARTWYFLCWKLISFSEFHLSVSIQFFWVHEILRQFDLFSWKPGLNFYLFVFLLEYFQVCKMQIGWFCKCNYNSLNCW